MGKLGILGFWLSLVIISNTALADEYKRFSDLSVKVRNQWSKQAASTVPFHTKSGLNCSAVFIGPNGEALTNLHCVEECLVSNGVTSAESLAGTKLTTIRVDANKLPVKCSAKIDTVAPIEEKQIEILHVFGPGWVSDRDEFNNFMNDLPDQYLALTDLGFESAGDMVLIRLPTKNNSCVELGNAEFNSTEPVDLVSLAYPIVFRKYGNTFGGFGDKTLFTLGMTLLWSTGQASSNEETLVKYLRPEYIPNVGLITPKGLLVGDTDTEGGASGSGLYDKTGKLVALTRSTWKGLSSEYLRWTSGAIDLAPHKESILNLVPDNSKCN